MAKIVIPAHTDHLLWLANNMAEADRDECAAGGMGPYRALESALRRSAAAWTGMVNDEPVRMFGVVPAGHLLGGIGAPWFSETPELQHHRISFLKHCRQYVSQMLDIFPHLVDFVDVRHKKAIRWLKWLGFEVSPEPVAFGPFKMPFYRFELNVGEFHR